MNPKVRSKRQIITAGIIVTLRRKDVLRCTSRDRM
jgi:hypothetical protein